VFNFWIGVLGLQLLLFGYRRHCGAFRWLSSVSLNMCLCEYGGLSRENRHDEGFVDTRPRGKIGRSSLCSRWYRAFLKESDHPFSYQGKYHRMHHLHFRCYHTKVLELAGLRNHEEMVWMWNGRKWVFVFISLTKPAMAHWVPCDCFYFNDGEDLKLFSEPNHCIKHVTGLLVLSTWI
jgi:hypothetical protein